MPAASSTYSAQKALTRLKNTLCRAMNCRRKSRRNLSMLKDLVKKCRSYRRFYEDTPISRGRTGRDGGYCPPHCLHRQFPGLKYRLVDSPEECDRLFPCLAWAGALKDWNGPEKGEQPSAYIVILCDLALGKTSSGMKASLPRPFCWQPRKWATAAV